MPSQPVPSHHWQGWEGLFRGAREVSLDLMTEQMQPDLNMREGKREWKLQALNLLCSEASGNQWNIVILFWKDIKWHHFYCFSVWQIHLCHQESATTLFSVDKTILFSEFKKFLRVLLCPGSVLSITLARPQSTGRLHPRTDFQRERRDSPARCSETEQDPKVLVPHVLCLPFFCGKNFSQRTSLIREVRKCRNKGKQSQETKL